MYDDLSAMPPKLTSLKDLDVNGLLQMRAMIDELLPSTNLANMDLEKELVVQFHIVKNLQTETLSGNEEANRKAMVAKTCADALQALVKMQSEFHTAERLKQIESRLIKSLNKVPQNYLADFFEFYESSAI